MPDAVGHVELRLGGCVTVDHIEHPIHLIDRIDPRLFQNRFCLYGMIVCEFLCIVKQRIDVPVLMHLPIT